MNQASTFEPECIACRCGNTFLHDHWHLCADHLCLSHIALWLQFCPKRHVDEYISGSMRDERVAARAAIMAYEVEA
jgi:hypothetical protein